MKDILKISPIVLFGIAISLMIIPYFDNGMEQNSTELGIWAALALSLILLTWYYSIGNFLHVRWNQLGKLAEKFYGDYSEEDYQSLLAKLDSVVEKIELLIEEKTNKQLYGVLWYEKWKLGRMIQFNTSSPYANARARLRKMANRNEHS